MILSFFFLVFYKRRAQSGRKTLVWGQKSPSVPFCHVHINHDFSLKVKYNLLQPYGLPLLSLSFKLGELRSSSGGQDSHASMHYVLHIMTLQYKHKHIFNNMLRYLFWFKIRYQQLCNCLMHVLASYLSIKCCVLTWIAANKLSRSHTKVPNLCSNSRHLVDLSAREGNQYKERETMYPLFSFS